MAELRFKGGGLSAEEQQTITDGFSSQTSVESAPEYHKDRVNWLAMGDDGELVGALTADVLWDWVYIDELWVRQDHRGGGLGRRLMGEAEQYARTHACTGLWLWTQSWQAAEFYIRMGYVEFARFPDFPRGHHRLGLRKLLTAVVS